MGIKTVPQPPYSQDLAPCDFCLFPKIRGCRNETIEGDERGCDEGHWHAHTRGLPEGLPEIVGTVQQVHCSRRRWIRRGLKFHVCTINKSAYTKKSGNLYAPLMLNIIINKFKDLEIVTVITRHLETTVISIMIGTLGMIKKSREQYINKIFVSLCL